MTWPTDTLDWFAQLEQNNTKAWFDANKTAYQEIENATRQFLERLSDDLGGDIKIFRLRRDARFSKNPTPYNTEQRGGIMTPDGTVRWIEINAHGVKASIGHPLWDKQQLARARAALVDHDNATALAEAITAATAAGLTIDHPEMKRPTKGLDENHPHPELTRHKHLAAARLHNQPSWLTKPDAGAHIATTWEPASALTAWLAQHVGAPSN